MYLGQNPFGDGAESKINKQTVHRPLFHMISSYSLILRSWIQILSYVPV